MKLCYPILFGFLLLIGTLNAQTDFKPGFIIENSGDTLLGEIDYRGDLLMGRICRFKRANGKVYEYSPKDIFAFRFIDDKYYISRKVDGKWVFLEFLLKGEINMYYLRDDFGDHYYMDKANKDLVELPYEEGIKHVGDKKVFFETKKHIGLLKYYMSDAPEFYPRISGLTKPNHHNLTKLAEDYHNAVCEGIDCIVYEKKQPFIKLSYEVIGGIVNFYDEADIIDKNYPQAGLLIHFWMPRANEKFYFKTGYMYTRVEWDDGGYKGVYKIPAHVGYLAPKAYRVRPSVSIGLLTPSYSGSIMLRLNKHINMGIQSWVNFFPNSKFFIIPGSLLNYSVLANVYLEF